MVGLKKSRASSAQKLKPKNSISSKTLLSSIFIALISFILGQGSLYGGIRPFGFAIILSCSSYYSLIALIGTSLGLLFSETGIYLFRYLITALTFFVIRNKLLTSRSRLGSLGISTFVSCILICCLTGVAVVIPVRKSFLDLLLFFAEGFIAAFTSFFYRRFIETVLSANTKALTQNNFTDIYITFATLIISVSHVKIFMFYPAVIVSVFAVMVMGFLSFDLQSIVFSCIIGSALSLSGEMPYLAFSVIFSCVVSGFFSPLGKIPYALSFLLSFVSVSFFAAEENFLPVILSACLSVFIFIVIPEKIYKKLFPFLSIKESSVVQTNYRKDVALKLSSAAKSIDSVRLSMNKVSENLKKIDSNSYTGIFCKVQNKICVNCEEKERCWTRGFQYTLRSFQEISKNYYSRVAPDSTRTAKLFLSRCVKEKELLTALYEFHKKQDDMLLEEIRLQEKRDLISRQMLNISSLLNDLSEEVSKTPLVDNELSYKVKNIFKSFSIACTKAVCIIDEDSTMTIKAYCKNIEKNLDEKLLRKEIEKITFRKFCDARVDFSVDGTVIIFRQRPCMQIKTGKFQISSSDSHICGDSLRVIASSPGHQTVILTDGMGTGGRAAIDATCAGEYFSDLISNSVSPDNALKIVNSMLSVKSTNESLSTIDVAMFNLFSGKVEFYKAGAAVSFVRKSGKCNVIEGVSLPVGILDEVSFAKEKIMLSKGDLIVMISDGAVADSHEWIKDEIEKFNKTDPFLLAENIAHIAAEKSEKTRRDDITVFVGIMTA